MSISYQMVLFQVRIGVNYFDIYAKCGEEFPDL